MLVFTDNSFHCVPIPGDADIPFGPSSGFNQDKESISAFTCSQRIRPGAFTHTSFNEERPSLDLLSKREGSIYKNLEVYDYTANYESPERGTAIARIRLEEQKTLKMKAKGQSSCPRLISGYKFTLTDHGYKDFEKEYLLGAIAHSGSQPQSLDAQAGGGGGYENAFICLPGDVKFRPARITPKPVVTGLQTAIVVGPQGEEIYTEKYAQVKVQFHWDRKGKRDEQSSCWIRAGQMWGGAGWGAQFVPRIGDEVLVDFLEGDPDQPIIVGCVYNEANQPIYDPKETRPRAASRPAAIPTATASTNCASRTSWARSTSISRARRTGTSSSRTTRARTSATTRRYRWPTTGPRPSAQTRARPSAPTRRSRSGPITPSRSART